ncbi:catalytic domain of components of various dehydrogenase complexes [Beutenbergia cavernae DSM 12333]|uniref:Dihydrolipoamide acetyltransferase component of pyruvate dehydrogenase complex n=1 Tax=Beutenbergia cavernae (strain ATCC BAA-8 / DSM 12333 / CCUG 43141 / JCM 11478 / NBRC 16432 / NCIMB 13614 / HKI 0122) TaxID=471853 RepID=C5C4H1_BEUC1|nr:dihydrolipoamide acetyltransferase family protein [Beutenbergia cavernae]ACQ82095.1 catalytic domain of components of various dehydrogenase complexes [Beutenbergia cavernae DSM 12333]
MAVREFRLPDLGEGLTESDIVSWRVAPGESVELNQIIAEVETAKALVELPSPYAGVVSALHAEPGQTVQVGEPLVTFEVAVAGGGGAEDDGGAAAASSGAAGAGSGEAGDAAPEGAPETEPAPAREATLVGYGARPERSGRPARRRRRTAAASTPSNGAAAAEAAPPAERPRSTPPVRALALRLGVDIAGVAGTGEQGLVTRDDVLAAQAREDRGASARGLASSGAAAGAAVESPANGHAAETLSGTDREPLAVAQTSSRERRLPVRGVRKHTAAAMVASAFTAPHASTHLTVDVTPSLELLDRLRAHPLTRDVRVTMLTLVARAVCLLLPRHPALNSAWAEDDAGAEIVEHGYVNLGIAVATDRGLVVPHLLDAEALGLPALAAALTDLVETARAGRTTPERLTGGTFTITNVGVFGVDGGTPILVPGEAAILALGAVRRRPWEHEDQIALRHVVELGLSFDHRMVDGEQAARFLAQLGELLADPALALVLSGAGGAA